MTDQCGGAETGAERQAVTLARTAIAQGLDALAANDLKVARRWLERAHRLVPHDANATLALAASCLTHDPRLAATLFKSITDKYDIRQAWFGLAAARLRTDGPEAAEQPLAAALSRYAFSPDITGLANAVGLRPGSPGWCALRSDGQLLIHARVPSEVRVLVDEVAISGAKLPSGWESRRTINVCLGDVPLLGTAIDVGAIRRVAGCVEVHDGGIRGWAWYPADPETPPVLTIRHPARNQQQTFVARDESFIVPDIGPLARPRSFSVTHADLLDVAGLVHIQGLDGTDLLGSPLDPFGHDTPHVPTRQQGHDDPASLPRHTAVACVQKQCVEAPPFARSAGTDKREPNVAVVMRVHDGGEVVLACLAGVLASVPPATRVVVVDDRSSRPVLIAALDDWAAQRKITLLRHSRMLGGPASANAGILEAGRCDVALLSCHALVPPNWIERLRTAAYASHDIGTVSPLSNIAGILSYSAGAVSTSSDDQAAANSLDRLAQRANGNEVIDIPAGMGFCLYLRRDCLDMTGLFRADLFAQGPGEEEDFCLRAQRFGWRSVALTGLFVGHVGGRSHYAAATHLHGRNSRIVEQCHPGHEATISSFLTSDPLSGARRRIDRLIWRARARKSRQSVILVTHNDGGGVEQQLIQAVARHAAHDRDAIILRPAETARGEPAVAVHDGMKDDLHNLVYTMPEELSALVALLRMARPSMIEAHHLAGYPPVIYDLLTRLKLPYSVHVHDYAWFCPRISLLDAMGRYCAEPDITGCEICVANNGHFLAEDITVSALRERSGGFLQAAQLVVAPCNDAGIRMRRHFNRLMPVTIPHEDDSLIARNVGFSAGCHARTSGTGRLTVCVPGAIGVHKGFDVLLACAHDAAQRDLDLEFVVVGHTIDDARMLATHRIFITGPFEPQEAVTLITAQQAHLGFIPSICPETWCLSLGDIWRAGLAVAAFDIGAQAERIRRYGQGLLLPLGLPAAAINDTLMAAIRPHIAAEREQNKIREVEQNTDYPSPEKRRHVACPEYPGWDL